MISNMHMITRPAALTIIRNLLEHWLLRSRLLGKFGAAAIRAWRKRFSPASVRSRH
jgi:hypothetical protein